MTTAFDKFVLTLVGMGVTVGVFIIVSFIMTRVGDGDFNRLKARVERIERILDKTEGHL